MNIYNIDVKAMLWMECGINSNCMDALTVILPSLYYIDDDVFIINNIFLYSTFFLYFSAFRIRL